MNADRTCGRSDGRALLREAGHDAKTVLEEGMGGADATLAKACRREDRVLVTLDKGFGDITAYPPEEHAGIVVLRPRAQDAASVQDLRRRVLPELQSRDLHRRPWIVDEQRIRIRSGDD